MNKRIKELYLEAIGKDWAYDFDPQVAEKFAELLIRDVVELVDDYDPIGIIHSIVLQHFGVE
jgi:hypothetical protein